MFGLDPGELLRNYGYVALSIGVFLEGETIVIVAGFFAQQGFLSPVIVALCSFCATLASDQLMFTLGRWKGREILHRFPRLEKNAPRAQRLLERYETPLILGFRFVYGVRNITPILMGMGSVGRMKFFVLNFIGAGVWAISFTAAGYFFGRAITAFLDNHPYMGRYILGGIAVVLLVVWLWRKKRKPG